MKYFMFPANYNRKEKFLGFIDYKIVTIIGVWGVCVGFIIKQLSCTWLVKLYIFLFLFGIPAIFLLVGFNGENMADVFRYIVKYFVRPKVYVYKRIPVGRKERRRIWDRFIR